MKIWHISDTHSSHSLLEVPKDIDLIIFSGDESNYYDVYKNEPEFRDFIEWFGNLPIKYKVFVGGNHSAFVALRTKEVKEICKQKDIIYLENESVDIEGFKIWGSPYSPTFGNWYFMKGRDKMWKLWENIPEDTDILITHTPPRGCLDLSYNRNHQLEFCGCSNLLKNIFRVKPKLHCYGHIHCFSSDTEILTNNGWKNIDNIDYNDKAINLNLNNNMLQVDKIKDIIKSDYVGKVLHVKGKNLDFITTLNHDLIDFSKNVPYKFKAEEINNKAKRLFKISGILEQQDYDISDNELRLMVQCTTDGSYEDNAWRFHLKKERKIKILLELLENMNITYSSHIQATGNIKIRFKYNFKLFPKPLHKDVLLFSQRQITILLEEYYITDGYKCKEHLKSYQINTCKKEEADILQQLCITSNRRCSISKRKNSENYTISINESTSLYSNKKSENNKIEDYVGKVWCITTDNGTVISRRNGKVIISGNSCEGVYNAGTMKLANLDTIFSNGSVVTDGKFGKVSSHGNIFEL